MVVRSRITGYWNPAAKVHATDAERRAGAKRRAEQAKADDRKQYVALQLKAGQAHTTRKPITLATINLPEVGDD